MPAALRLTFSTRPATVQVSGDGREILVEFPGVLQERELSRAAAALGPLLEG